MSGSSSKYESWSKHELILEIQKTKKYKKHDYGLTWDESNDEINEKFTNEKNTIPIIKEIKNKEIISQTGTNNILIEGDNYHALSILNYTHKGKIDVIYIDPPYNTGKEFIYNDKLVDKEDGFKHSKWLSFMSNRLKLAKTLLSNKGVIFISIDDNEVAQLKLLCDKIFNANNFIASITWQKKYSPQNNSKYFSDMHDFVLVYAKHKNIGNEKVGWILNLLHRTEEMDSRYTNPDNDPRGIWKSTGMDVKGMNKNNIYGITTPTGKIIYPPKGRSWCFSKQRFEDMINDNRIVFGRSGDGVPRLKKFITEVRPGKTPTTWWDRDFAGHNQLAKQELDKFDLKTIFETPKPVKLITRILQIATNNNSIILDFFAGSGTTGQAVLELNKQDNGNRRFILCTNNEGDICTTVCYPRIKKVIKGYKYEGNKQEILFEDELTYNKLKDGGIIYNEIEEIKENNKKKFNKIVPSIKNDTIKVIGYKQIKNKNNGLGGNLKYFKTSFINCTPTDHNKKQLTDNCAELLCLKENCFKQIKQTRSYSVFANDKKYLGIIYDETGIEKFKKHINKSNKYIVYVFSLDDSAYEEEFEEFTNITTKPIPQDILNAYRRIFG